MEVTHLSCCVNMLNSFASTIILDNQGHSHHVGHKGHIIHAPYHIPSSQLCGCLCPRLPINLFLCPFSAQSAAWFDQIAAYSSTIHSQWTKIDPHFEPRYGTVPLFAVSVTSRHCPSPPKQKMWLLPPCRSRTNYSNYIAVLIRSCWVSL